MELPIAGMCNGGPTRAVGQSGALGPKEALIYPTLPPGQPAADPHGSGHKGACLGGDTHLSWLHLPGCWAKDSAVRTWPGPQGDKAEVGGGGRLAWPGLTRGATRLCVCEDPRLRRRRRALPLGELRVPLRKLVPNRARSFNVCLEKRKLVSGAGTGWGVGTKILVVGKLERGAARRGTLGNVWPR